MSYIQSHQCYEVTVKDHFNLTEFFAFCIEDLRDAELEDDKEWIELNNYDDDDVLESFKTITTYNSKSHLISLQYDSEDNTGLDFSSYLFLQSQLEYVMKYQYGIEIWTNDNSREGYSSGVNYCSKNGKSYDQDSVLELLNSLIP
jgi:hypothetical protein